MGMTIGRWTRRSRNGRQISKIGLATERRSRHWSVVSCVRCGCVGAGLGFPVGVLRSAPVFTPNLRYTDKTKLSLIGRLGVGIVEMRELQTIVIRFDLIRFDWLIDWLIDPRSCYLSIWLIWFELIDWLIVWLFDSSWFDKIFPWQKWSISYLWEQFLVPEHRIPIWLGFILRLHQWNTNGAHQKHWNSLGFINMCVWGEIHGLKKTLKIRRFYEHLCLRPNPWPQENIEIP